MKNDALTATSINLADNITTINPTLKDSSYAKDNSTLQNPANAASAREIMPNSNQQTVPHHTNISATGSTIATIAKTKRRDTHKIDII